MANMVMGMLLLNRRYTPTKYLSVIMITIGIATCTIMSAKSVKGHDGKNSSNSTMAEDRSEQEEDLESSNEMFQWCIGISMLTFALFLSARMGIYQEVIYKKYGKHPKEALFYSVSFYKG